jgi:hypothetical protein
MTVKYLFESTKTALRSEGATGTLKLVHGYLGNKFFPATADETARRFRLGQRLSKEFDNTVAYGPFRGLILSDTSWWGAADRGSMLLGIYEQEVLAALKDLSAGRSTFIDLGAADGYYAVGAVTSGLFAKSIAFEVSELGQAAVAQNAFRNSVGNRVRVLGEAKPDFLYSLRKDFELDLSSTVLLVDIEGAEFDLLSVELLRQLRRTALIVEVHDFQLGDSGQVEQLLDRAEEFFEISWITTGQRDLSEFSEIDDWPEDDRWILCSESRPKRMRWLVLKPK